MIEWLSNPRSFCHVLFVIVALGIAPVSTGFSATKKSPADLAKERAFFEKKIRPVLVKHCYSCHSAGAKKIGGKLRLDLPESVRLGGESGPAIVSGHPEKSLIIQSLKYEHLEMPPKSPLAKSVIKDFEDWVKMGAPDPRGQKLPPKAAGSVRIDPNNPALWSFLPLRKSKPPVVNNSAWVRDPLDQYILAKIEAAKVLPARDASARTLARRLYFDLIGLPPSLNQLATFEAAFKKIGQQAVVELVDQLLDSPHFGERWGRHWLDVARYGESNGNDGLSRNPTFPHAWRYRDFVIQSFNNDVPYDRFITEQIAGDLLPADSPEERDRLLIATGFLALGSKPAKAMNINFDMDVVDDQINVVSTGIMGLSVACARCHDHKHDPIPTRDYYALAGIFRSTETLWGLAANEKLTAPATPLHELKSKQYTQVRASTETLKPVNSPDVTPVFAERYSQAIKALNPTFYSTFQSAPESAKIESGVTIDNRGYGEFKSGRIQVQLAEPAKDFSVAFWFLNATLNKARPVTAYLFSYGPGSAKPAPGDHLGITGNYKQNVPGQFFTFNGNARNQSVKGKTIIKPNTWNHVVYVRSGKRVTTYLNGQSKPEFQAEIDRTAVDAKVFFIGSRNDRFAPLVGRMAHFAFFNRPITPDEAEKIHKASGQAKGTSKPYPNSVASPKQAAPKSLAMGVRDRAKPGDCKVNIKGESNKLGPVVARGFLSASEHSETPISVNGKQSGRLELARWLTRSDHPQTARVMTNRIWLHLFGQGIVNTPDDFGVYGSRPSHPELLDHLAKRFIDDGWSIKRMIRTIILSRTYQLSSQSTPESFEQDPGNRLFARHDRRRLDAESLRDAILRVSGQLDAQPGQGSIIQDHDVLVNQSGSLHQPSNHRSVYLCMLRNSPPPALAAFNLPQFTNVTGQRDVTTLPSHALFLLNNQFVVEQSRHLAKRALHSAGNTSDASKISWIYRRTLNREPNANEMSGAIDLVNATLQSLTTITAKNERRQINAWGTLCQALIASNEFRYID